jgi:hypothetical protein
MTIHFHPPLGEQIRVVCPGSQADGAIIWFTATAVVDGGLRLAEEGIKLQLWSDLPARGRPSGEWGELAFESEVAQDITAAVGLDLASESCSGNGSGTEHTLHLHARVFVAPYAEQKQTRLSFAYTYRLVFPDGSIKWLGEYGQNGQLMLEWKEEMAASLISWEEGWLVQPDRSYIWDGNTKGRIEDEVILGKLSKKVEWVVWAIARDGSVWLHRLIPPLIILHVELRLCARQKASPHALAHFSSSQSLAQTPLYPPKLKLSTPPKAHASP